MAEVNEGLPPGVDFQLRVGINTGEVLAGAVGESYTVTGDTVNVASRLQSAARPGSVTVGERTMRATRGAVRYEELQPARAEGQGRAGARLGGAEPDGHAQRAAGRGPRTSRRSWAATTSWSRSRRSTSGWCERARPHLVSLIGEAGVGKIAAAARVRARARASTRSLPPCAPAAASPTARASSSGRSARCCAPSAGSWTPTPPRRPGGSSRPTWPACSATARELNEPGEREAALIGRLLGIEVPPELVPAERDPERLREAFFSALRMGMEKMASRRPLVLAFEDIHWADDGMLDAIEHLAQWVRAPLMLVCLARDELLDRRPGWGAGRRSATQLLLDPLAAEDTHELVAALHPGRRRRGVEGGGALRRQPALRRGDGAPGGRGGNLGAAELPDTVQAVLAARLDALEPVRAAPRAAGRRGGTNLLGGLAGAAGRGGGPRARAGRSRCSRRRTSSPPAPRAGSRASASSPSSTC